MMPFVVSNFGFSVPIRYWTAGIKGNKVIITQLIIAYAKAEKFTAIPRGNHPSAKRIAFPLQLFLGLFFVYP